MGIIARLSGSHACLDVACGTGIWGRELAREFPQAQVISFDIDRAPVDAALQRLGPAGQFPTNFRFLEADAFQPFPFEPDLFDFTHARLIGSFTPVARWPDVVAEMVRVTRPGGYVELVDFEIGGQSPSQAIMALGEAMSRLMTMRGLHPGSAPYLAGYLRGAGLEEVDERPALVGSGPQGNREQRLLITDILATFANLQPLVVKIGVLTDADYTTLLERARVEAPALGASLPIVCAFGRKPIERGRRSGFVRY